jgi:hypothetical protein
VEKRLLNTKNRSVLGGEQPTKNIHPEKNQGVAPLAKIESEHLDEPLVVITTRNNCPKEVFVVHFLAVSWEVEDISRRRASTRKKNSKINHFLVKIISQVQKKLTHMLVIKSINMGFRKLFTIVKILDSSKKS